MPSEPNQQPFPGQQKLLSVERIQSSIPKGGTKQTWLYPSPQMFFNCECCKHLLFAAEDKRAYNCVRVQH